MLYLIVQIDQTRKQLQSDGVLEFNFIQQADHNFDSFAKAVMDYQLSPEPTMRNELREHYITRYDVLYSLFNSIGRTWLGSIRELEVTQNLLLDANRFLDTYEPLMSPDITLDTNSARAMSHEAFELSGRVYDIGLQMFERKSSVRDSISRRMDDLYDALWVFGLSFLLASMMTILLLLTLSRRAANLSADAQQTQNQLSSALDELTSGDIARQAQNRFMAAASHDLRQPLHALGLYLIALKKHVTSLQGQHILANINRSTEALNQLLNSMLDLSKLDAGVVDVNLESLCLDTIFDYLHQNFLPEANERELALKIQYSGLTVHSDQLLLERILGNLVSNALNYTVTGSVTVQANQRGNEVEISVIDTGPGIPKDEQEAIFNEYYQLNNPERDRSKGLGLGLSIVKRLTHLLTIELQIDSTVGQGSRFHLTLPAGLDSEKSTFESDSSVIEAHTKIARLSILVIDDEHEVREGMLTLLKQYECDVVVADSADSALEHIIATQWVPELIIADYRLRNNQTGDKAIECVREEINMDVPAMIITGDTSPARLRDATSSGFQLLHKPVGANELLKAITQLVSTAS